MAELPIAGVCNVTISLNSNKLQLSAADIVESTKNIINSGQDTSSSTGILISDWTDDVSLNYELAEITFRSMLNDNIKIIGAASDTVELFAKTAEKINAESSDAVEK